MGESVKKNVKLYAAKLAGMNTQHSKWFDKLIDQAASRERRFFRLWTIIYSQTHSCWLNSSDVEHSFHSTYTAGRAIFPDHHLANLTSSLL